MQSSFGILHPIFVAEQHLVQQEPLQSMQINVVGNSDNKVNLRDQVVSHLTFLCTRQKKFLPFAMMPGRILFMII